MRLMRRQSNISLISLEASRLQSSQLEGNMFPRDLESSHDQFVLCLRTPERVLLLVRSAFSPSPRVLLTMARGNLSVRTLARSVIFTGEALHPGISQALKGNMAKVEKAGQIVLE